MGIDFQFIAYTGVPLTDDSLAKAIVQHVRTVLFYRHAKAPLAGREDLHCVALYEGPDDSTEATTALQETQDTELSRLAILARELSRVVGKIFWVAQGDHSNVGGYASFENGMLVDPPSENDIYVDGEGYRDVPAKKWLAATGTGVTPNDVFFTAFLDADDLPIHLATDLATSMTFDPAQFTIWLE